MAFFGCHFIFDDKESRDFGLMLYNIGQYSQDEAVAFASTGSPVKDSVAGRYSTLFYGVKQDIPLRFNMVFGAEEYFMDRGLPILRPHVEKIAGWLTGHNEMKWLEILQPDMIPFRYKCHITDLRLITFGGNPWAFSATVTCDSPFAYYQKEETDYQVRGSLDIDFENISSYKGFYKPEMIIKPISNGDISIINKTDGNREFKLTDLVGGSEITVDNYNEILTDETRGINLYSKFNFNFFRLKQGFNELVLTGDFDIKFITAFPMDIGA